MRKTEILIFGIIIISVVISLVYYPKLPGNIVTHWNINGEIDGYSSKFIGVFVTPLLLIMLAVIFFLILNIYPLKENIKKFRGYFDYLIILIFIFLVFLQLQIILWNLGTKIDIAVFISISFAMTLFYVGILIENAKKNWFIGIRTPWTLSDDKIWYKIHKLGGVLFKIAGLISLLGVLIKKYSFFIMIIPALVSIIYLIFYSYFEFKKQSKKT